MPHHILSFFILTISLPTIASSYIFTNGKLTKNQPALTHPIATTSPPIITPPTKPYFSLTRVRRPNSKTKQKARTLIKSANNSLKPSNHHLSVIKNQQPHKIKRSPIKPTQLSQKIKSCSTFNLDTSNKSLPDLISNLSTLNYNQSLLNNNSRILSEKLLGILGSSTASDKNTLKAFKYPSNPTTLESLDFLDKSTQSILKLIPEDLLKDILDEIKDSDIINSSSFKNPRVKREFNNLFK